MCMYWYCAALSHSLEPRCLEARSTVDVRPAALSRSPLRSAFVCALAWVIVMGVSEKLDLVYLSMHYVWLFLLLVGECDKCLVQCEL